MRYRNIEKIDEESVNATMFAPVNVGRRKSDRSNIAQLLRRSTTTKAAIRTAAPTSIEMIVVELQPLSLPRTSANTSRKSDPENVTKPAQSMPVHPGSKRLLDARERDGHRGDADRDVDEEDPLPADAARDDAADQRPDGDGCAGYGSEDAECRRALAARKGLRDERE